MFENEGLGNEVIVDKTEEVNFLVVPEEAYTSEIEENSKDLNGVLIGAAVAATGIVAYKYGPKVVNKFKRMFGKESSETLEEKQLRLLEELAKVNEQLTSTDLDEK